MLDMQQYKLTILKDDKFQKITFEANCHLDDVRRTANRLARLRGINLSECRHQIIKLH